jgi:hypothetical protein
VTGLCTLTATDIRENWPDTPLVPCEEPVIAVITFACVHEHVNIQPACLGCTVEIEQCEDVLICPRCEDAGCPDCKVTIKIEWLCEITPEDIERASRPAD